MTLTIIDVAGSYQPVSTIANWLNRIAGAVVKASEGAHTVIAEHDSQVAYLRSNGKLVGHYHYAWPEHGGETEAANFLAAAKAQSGDVLALDFEPYKSTAPASVWPEYIVSFANSVHSATGAWPWIYLNDYHAGLVVSNSTTAQLAIIRNLPLWKAGVNGAYVSSPSNGPGNIHGWSRATMFQWTSTNIDQNVFYGDVSTWHALAIPSKGDTNMATTDDVLAAVNKLIAQEAGRYSDYVSRFTALANQIGNLANYIDTAFPQRYLASDGSVSFDPTKGTPIRYMDTADGNQILNKLSDVKDSVAQLGTQLPTATVDYAKITAAIDEAVNGLATLEGTVSVSLSPKQ